MNRVLLRCLAVPLMIAFTSGCAAFCVSFKIRSEPPGANILLNNQPTGQSTPARFYIKDIARGTYDITLKKDGYKTITDTQKIRVATHTGSIVGSVVVFVPCGIIQIFGDRWKGVYIKKWNGQFVDRTDLVFPHEIDYRLNPCISESTTTEPPQPSALPTRKSDHEDVTTQLKTSRTPVF